MLSTIYTNSARRLQAGSKGEKMLENLGRSLPVLAAGFAGSPGLVGQTIEAGRAGRQDREEANLRKFGKLLMDEWDKRKDLTKEKIVEMAKAAGVTDFSKVLPLVQNIVKFKADVAREQRASRDPYTVRDPGGIERQIMALPGQEPEGAMPGVVTHRPPAPKLREGKEGLYQIQDGRADLVPGFESKEMRPRTEMPYESTRWGILDSRSGNVRVPPQGMDDPLKALRFEKMLNELVEQEIATMFPMVTIAPPQKGTAEYENLQRTRAEIRAEIIQRLNKGGGTAPAAAPVQLPDPKNASDADVMRVILGGGQM